MPPLAQLIEGNIKMLRILNAEPLDYSDQARAILRSLGQVDEYTLTRPELIVRLAGYAVLIVRLSFQVDREILDAGKRLKVIVTATTGLDHIDVAYAEQCGIQVLSLRGQIEFLRTIPATAEHTWALLLALVRRVPWAFQAVLDRHWERDLFRGYDLWGKRLGIVGLGRIGEKVARFGLAFGMRVAAYDPYHSHWAADITRFETLTEMLKQTDILSIHVPLNTETEHLIGREELNCLPTPCWLVNTSRGEVLDEAALIEALEEGRLCGAALDVISGERQFQHRPTHPLLAYALEHDNLLITPHIGGATRESMAMTEVFMAKQLQRFLQAINCDTDRASV